MSKVAILCEYLDLLQTQRRKHRFCHRKHSVGVITQYKNYSAYREMGYNEGLATSLLFKQANRCMRSHILIKTFKCLCSQNDSICKVFLQGLVFQSWVLWIVLKFSHNHLTQFISCVTNFVSNKMLLIFWRLSPHFCIQEFFQLISLIFM